jgi:hypothetical protein
MTFSFGDETFLDITGFPELYQQQLEPVVRAGIDGTGFWETGSRGRPFSIRTAVDAASLAEAFATYARYCEFPAADPKPMVYADIDLEGYGYQFQALSVRPIAICALAAASGGLNPPSLGWCEAEWQLVAVQMVES